MTDDVSDVAWDTEWLETYKARYAELLPEMGDYEATCRAVAYANGERDVFPGLAPEGIHGGL